MARFEELLRARQEGDLRAEELSAAIGVSDRLLRRRCREELGMSPISYVRLRALHAVHHILQNQGSEAGDVSHITRGHGFRHPGHLAATYRSPVGGVAVRYVEARTRDQSVAHPARRKGLPV